MRSCSCPRAKARIAHGNALARLHGAPFEELHREEGRRAASEDEGPRTSARPWSEYLQQRSDPLSCEERTRTPSICWTGAATVPSCAHESRGHRSNRTPNSWRPLLISKAESSIEISCGLGCRERSRGIRKMENTDESDSFDKCHGAHFRCDADRRFGGRGRCRHQNPPPPSPPRGRDKRSRAAPPSSAPWHSGFL